MRKKFLLAVLVSCSALPVQLVFAQYNVKNYGAKGDGITLETRYIQDAIDEAFKNGGGRVDVPAGEYLIGTIVLKDNIDLCMGAGSVLKGSGKAADYREIKQKFDSRTRDLYAKYFMIFAEDAGNVSITGQGTIYGQGERYFRNERPQNERPFMIRFVNCRNVAITGVSLQEAANWTLHLLACKDVNVDGIVIENSGKGNRDGIDIDACQRVTVANSRFRTTDDAIVLKSTCDTMCQDITITNCILRSHASAVKTGTESNGGFKNITVSNCVIKDIPVHTAIELITVDGGILQNVLLDNIAMENVATPLFIRVGLRCRPYKPGQYVKEIGEVKDIRLNNISVLDAKLPSSIMGLNNRVIRNVSVSNYTVRYSRAGEGVPYNEVPFEEFSYPMALVFKNVPAYGLYCRNVEGLQIENVNMYAADGELRPALGFDRVNGLELVSVNAEVKNRSIPVVHMRNVRNVYARFCRSLNDTEALFEKETGSCSNLNFSGNYLREEQVEIREIKALPDDHIFNDFHTEIKYSADGMRPVKELSAYDLSAGPLRFSLDINKKGSLQLCLLVLSESPQPEKILIRYEGITQEFMINWDEWGWAPITLLKEYTKDTNVKFEILSGKEGSHLRLAKAYLRYQDIGFTD